MIRQNGSLSCIFFAVESNQLENSQYFNHSLNIQIEKKNPIQWVESRWILSRGET